jgi:hypothetical protein
MCSSAATWRTSSTGAVEPAQLEARDFSGALPLIHPAALS